MSDVQHMKLGKRLGVVDDPRTFYLESLFAPVFPQPPVESRYSRDATWPVFANNRYGDCCFASQGHRIQLQERNAGQAGEIQLTDTDILEAYTTVTGFDPNRPDTDNGAYLLDVLNYMRRVGMGRERDGSRHTIYAFARFDHRDLMHVRTASWLFGGVYTGVLLPENAQDNPYDWKVEIGPGSEPGSWGGHAVTVNGYDSRYVYLVTWGRQARMSWAFWSRYVDEAYVVISEDFLNKLGQTRHGFRRDQLDAWLGALR